MTVNTGPIPGENYTSDTKNYPWRQPPEFSDLDDALDWFSKKLTQFQVANGILSMAEMGFPLYKITGMLLTMGVGEGKWTVDHTLLLAGPVCRMIELVCIGFDVDYDLGIYDDEDDFNTGNLTKHEQELRKPKGSFKLLNEELPELKEEANAQEGGGEQTPDLQTQGFMEMSKTPSAQGAKGQSKEQK